MFPYSKKQNHNGPFRLGILKGGQLARMLLQASMNYDLATVVMDSDPDCPCRNFCSEFIQGDALNFDDVYAFGRKVDAIVLEFEHVNLDALEKLEAEGLPISPSPKAIRIIQDKYLQKEFYRSSGIPTAPYSLINSAAELAAKAPALPAVQKLRVSGYDGKGVRMLNQKEDLTRAFDAPSIVEEKVNFIKEIAVIVARNASGDIATYPAVEMEFNKEGHMLDLLSAPADISAEVKVKAQELAVTIAQKISIVGLLAVEMFVTADNRVLVNEMAPRTHNSGHHTIEASDTSQFEQHLRTVLNLPLGSTATRSPAVMVNLLGEKEFKGPAVYQGIEKVLSVPGIHVHLYGKSNTAPLRKMGHVTILDQDLAKAKEKARWVKSTVKVIA